jgi:hypothetical protein
MKRGGLVVRSEALATALALAIVLALVVVVGAGALGVQAARAQDEHVLFLPLLAKADGGPAIHYFRADVEIADPGQTIELQWASTGGVTAGIWRVERGGPIAEMWDVAPSGTMTYTIGAWEREYMQFSLHVADAAGNLSGAGLTLPLTCPDTWFFAPAPPGCPGGPALVGDGAEQAFEHGYMVWVENGWGAGTPGIYVLYADAASPRWNFYEDTWQEGEPLCATIPPPPGRQQPERGFGKLWCEVTEVSQRLGWALEKETAYEAAVQRDSNTKYSNWYVRSSDGNVWKLLPERSGWEKIVVE